MILWVVPSYALDRPFEKFKVAVETEDIVLVSYLPTFELSPDVP